MLSRILLFLFFIGPQIAIGQIESDFFFQHLNSDMGLSSNHISSIVQDKRGIIWIATNYGLNKYDGSSVKSYLTNDSASRLRLPDNDINSLFIDSRNNLWIATDFGVSSYDFNLRVTQFYHYADTTGHKIANDQVTSFCEDKSGNIWIGTKAGFTKVGLNGITLRTYFLDTLSTNPHLLYTKNRVGSLCFDPKGNLWLATLNGLWQFDPASEKVVQHYIFNQDSSNTWRNRAYSLYIDKQDTVWVAMFDEGVFKMDIHTGKYIHYENQNSDNGLSSDNVRQVLRDQEGNLWVATMNGLNMFDGSHNRFSKIYYNSNKSGALTDNKISCLFQDRSGILWVGTHGGGINRFLIRGKRFHFSGAFPGKNLPGNSNQVNDFLEEGEGNFWIGSSGGLHLWNSSGKFIKSYFHQPGNPNSLINDNVYALWKDETGRLWVGTEKGISILNKSRTSFDQIDCSEGNKHKIPTPLIFDILPVGNNKLWLATGRGLVEFNRKTGLALSRLNDLLLSKIHQGFTFHLYKDSKNFIWLRTDRAYLYKLDTNRNVLKRFGSGPYSDVQLPSNNVHDIKEDKNGMIWIATQEGLCAISNDTIVKVYNSRNGLLINKVNSLQFDKRGNLWLSTNSGLTRFYITSKKFSHYDKQDGLLSNEFNIGTNYLAQNGTLFFGGALGFTYFDPDLVRTNTHRPSIIFTSLKVFDKEVLDADSLSALSDIYLPYKDNYFEVHFSALNYDRPEKNQYAYILTGLDKKWELSKNRNFARYTNVPPGDYVFCVKASNNDGAWNHNGVKIRIHIRPAFWQTYLFKVAISVTPVAILGMLIFWRIRLIKRREAENTRVNRMLEEEKMTALRAQMNPHFIFNLVNSIQQYILDNERRDALHYLAKFSRLLRFTLQSAGKNSNDLMTEMELLSLYIDLQSIRFSDKLSYEFEVDAGIDQQSIFIPSLLLQPFVENAIEHGILNKDGPGKVSIRVTQNDGWLFCTIEDDGIGRVKAQQLKSGKRSGFVSMGISISQKRLENLSYVIGRKGRLNITDLYTDKGEACGTHVSIWIPLETDN